MMSEREQEEEEEKVFDSYIWKDNSLALEEYAKFHREHPHCTTPRKKVAHLVGDSFCEDENYPGNV
jgi:hypothetical protein